MSDQFYAAQYRDMHTAIHHIAIFSLEEKAKEFLAYVEINEELPPHDFYEPLNFVMDIEIDYRKPPEHCPEEGIRLIYVNENFVPDAY